MNDVIDRAGAVMAQFLTILCHTSLSLPEIAQRSGITGSSIAGWGIHSSPKIQNFEAVVAVLGYRLQLVPDVETRANESNAP